MKTCGLCNWIQSTKNYVGSASSCLLVHEPQQYGVLANPKILTAITDQYAQSGQNAREPALDQVMPSRFRRRAVNWLLALSTGLVPLRKPGRRRKA